MLPRAMAFAFPACPGELMFQLVKNIGLIFLGINGPMGFALQVKRAALEFFGQGLFTLNLSSGSSFRGRVGVAKRCF